MARYVFLNMPGRGHVNPTLPIVQELVRRGHNVSYYLTEEYHTVVEATGATFQPYESQMMGLPGGTQSSGTTANMSQFMLDEMISVPLQVLDRIRTDQPDVIIYDFLCVWAKRVIDELHVPAITTRATYASNEHFNLMEVMMKNMPGASEMMSRLIESMAEQDASSPNLILELFHALSHVEKLNIVFIPREFQPEVETFDDSYLFVGPSVLPRQDAPDFPFEQLNNNLPLLYISLGSVFTNQPEFYQMCFAAFANQPWQVVLTIGKYTDLTALGSVPANFLLAAYVPQIDILPRTRLFVTHAGTNSIMESIYFGVPMVLIPQQSEHNIHAQRVVDLGIGFMLDKEYMTADTLRTAVECVNHNEGYRERAQHMQQSIRTEGGYQRAVDAILQFTQEHINEQKV